MIMADADILDVFGLQLQLGDQFDDTLLRRRGSRTLPEAGIPHHVVVTGLDQEAAADKLNLESVVGVRADKGPTHFRRGTSGAPVDARPPLVELRLPQRLAL